MLTTLAVRASDPESRGSPSHRLKHRIGARLRFAAPALLGYALVRAIGLLVLFSFAQRTNRPVTSLLSAYDGGWYLGIAVDGYDTSVGYDDDGLKNTNIAFFPLYPMLIRIFAALGLAPLHAGLGLAFAGGLAAAWGIFAVGARIGGRSSGVVLAVLWGVLPHAVVQNMVYAETLFTALCAWSLWAILDGRWITAGLLAFGAGLTRPSAVALMLAIACLCLVRLARGQDGWRPLVAAILSPLGMIGFWVWCAIEIGRPDAWFWMQREGWGTYFDLGRVTLRGLKQAATREPRLAILMTTAVLVLAVLLLALLVLGRDAPWPVIVFAGASLALTLLQGGGYYHAKARFLIGAFPLLIPAALALARARPHVRYSVLVLLTLVSAWYGSYLMLTWTASP